MGVQNIFCGSLFVAGLDFTCFLEINFNSLMEIYLHIKNSKTAYAQNFLSRNFAHLNELFLNENSTLINLWIQLIHHMSAMFSETAYCGLPHTM